jgi:uncharacterized protein YndB with AHSA1/START domain
MPDTPTAQDQQILITRIFDAPRDLVFRAWTDPRQVAQWFGPEGFDTPPETGARFPVRYEIIEVVPPRLLVLKSEPMPEIGILEATFTRIELHDHGDKTRMSMSDGPYTHATPAEAGWNGAFAKLEALLA